MSPLLQFHIFLRPPEGPSLVLKDEVSWIGRGSFELSQKAQSICSRRQACVKHTNSAVQLECHGLNPVCFVVCHSVKLQASEDTPLSSLYLLRKGQAVELTDGDQFFLAPRECLLTVGIKHVNSGCDGAALQLTPDAPHLQIRDDRPLADQVVSPKATQKEQASAICLVEQPRMLQRNVPRRHLPAEVYVPSDNRCLAGDICNLDPAELKCFTCPAGEGCKCNPVDKPLTPLSGCEVPLVNDCSVPQVDFSKTAAIRDLALGEALIDTSRSICANNASKTTSVPEGPSVNEELGLDNSSASAGELLNSNQGGILAVGSSKDGRVCGSSNGTSGETLAQLNTSNGGLDSRCPLKVVAVDHNDVAEASKQIVCGNSTGSPLSAVVLELEAKQIQDNKPSANICRLDLLQPTPKIGQPCSFSSLSLISSPSPFPRLESDVEVAATCRNPFLAEIPQQQGSMQAVSPSEAAPIRERQSLDHLSSGLAIRSEGNNLVDGRTMASKGPDIIDLTITENEENSEAQIQSETVHVGPNMTISSVVGPIQGMETVIATVSGYDNLVRARLISLINLTGAVYTGSLTNSNTHVVCWKFRGAKFEMAKKLGKNIINHRWFEDCLKSGTRLSEVPYTSSGELAEPLQWDHISVQHPSSKAGLGCEQLSHLLLMEKSSQGLCRSGIVGGQSSVPSTRSGNIAECSGEIPSSSRMDRGKRHSVVNLNSPADSRLACNLGVLARDVRDMGHIGRPTRAGGAQAINLSTPHLPQDQESDEFWNEVIRTCDDRGKEVADHLCLSFPETVLGARLKEHRTRRTRQSSFPMAGSSSREPNLNFGDEIIYGQLANEAQPSGDAQNECVHEALQSHSSMRDQSGNVLSEDDYKTGYPEVLLRKRKHVSAGLSGHISGKHRRLVRKQELVGVSDELPNPVGIADGTVGGVRTEGQPAYVTDPTQQRASTLDSTAECEQSVGVIDTLVQSACKPGEQLAESQSSTEITCVICHSETKAITEGVLSCGHKFCYPCIQRWADEAKLKSPTCPLCKVPFEFITFREIGQAGGGESCSPIFEERIVVVGQQTRQETRLSNLPSLRTENLCVTCGSRDTAELLLICTNCRERACHTFCLDPPRPPGSSWFCSRCSQTQSRMQTREAYGRLFQGGSPQSAARQQLDIVDLALHRVTENGFRPPYVLGQSSRTPPRRARGRQHSLYNFLVRQQH